MLFIGLRISDIRSIGVAGLLVAVVVLAAAFDPTAPVAAEAEGAGNGFYRLFVNDTAGGDGLGAFTIATGPDHPLGEGVPLLFGGGSGEAWASYVTVRSYTTGTDYVQTLSGPSSGDLVTSLDAYGAVEPIGSTGYRAAYDLPGTGATPDALNVTADLNVEGNGADGSLVRMTTTVTHAGDVPVSLGVRYLLDLQLAEDDGPALDDGPGSPRSAEMVSQAPFAQPFAFTGNGEDDSRLRFAVSGGPGPDPHGALPDLVQYAYWEDAFRAAFDYDPDPERDIAAAGGLDDSALLYYFGASEESALSLAPEESLTFTVSLAPSVAPDEQPCSDCPSPQPTPTPPAVSRPPGSSTLGEDTGGPAALPDTGGPPPRWRR